MAQMIQKDRNAALLLEKASERPISEKDLELINQYTMKTVTSEDVYVLEILANSTEIDRDFERFTAAALDGLAKMYPGKPLIFSHDSRSLPVGRCFDAFTRGLDNGHTGLVVKAYIPRSESDIVNAIEMGVYKEVSVSVGIGKAICSVCGKDYYRDFNCNHIRGREYDGTVCTIELDDAQDVYELSFVTIPAQPSAGVLKAASFEKKVVEKESDPEPEPPAPPDPPVEPTEPSEPSEPEEGEPKTQKSMLSTLCEGLIKLIER